MNLTSEQAVELLDGKKYLSYRFQLFNATTNSHHAVYLNKKQADDYSHQFVKVTSYNFNQSKVYNHGWRAYKLTAEKGDLFIYSNRNSEESLEFAELLSLIYEYPSSYQYYLGDLKENDIYVDLIVFIDICVFMKYYTNDGYLSKNIFKIIQKYALNQYKIYRIKDCSNESEYSSISPNFKLSLYDYQKQTLNWMSSIENKNYKLFVPQSCFFKIGDGSYIELIGKQTKSFLSHYVFDNDYQTNELIKCRGGVLADIMGNGKTVTTIALIYHNRPMKLPFLTSIVEREVYVPSLATLVVCPTNIATQWEDEIYKCLGPFAAGLKIIKITCKTQMDKYDLAQLVNADIIITTYAWLTNKSHIGTGFIRKGTEFLIDQKKNKIKHGDKYSAYSKFTLLFILYHRIIYDEFHEEIDSNQGQNSFLYIIKNCLKAKNIWGISGTPLLENPKIIGNISDLLQIRDSHNNIYSLDVVSQHGIFDRFVRRNEKQYLPPIDYRVVNVKQTIQEKQLYDSSLSQSIETLMQLCCYHNMNSMDIQNIDDVAKIQDGIRQKQKIELNEKITNIITNMKQIECMLRAMDPNFNQVSELYYLIDSKHPKHTHKLVQQIQQTPTLQLQVESLRQYRKFSQQLEERTYEFNKLEQCINYYNQTVKNNLINGNLICPITGEQVGDGEVVITKEGNLFSKNAIEILFEYSDGKYITCPVSGNQLSRTDITIVTNKQKPEESLNSNERVFGSKIAKIIHEIKSLNDSEKVIIFGRWDKMLHTIGYAFDINNIDYVYIKGNINIRDKSIHEFRTNSKIKAILLSSEYGASGVNLVEANHVFIVHPFYGEDGHQYERQAIGRSHRTGQTRPVHVSFFITENTIEQDLWEKNRKHYYFK